MNYIYGIKTIVVCKMVTQNHVPAWFFITILHTTNDWLRNAYSYSKSSVGETTGHEHEETQHAETYHVLTFSVVTKYHVSRRHRM